MDRGAWQATVHGITRVKHHLTTKQDHAKNSYKNKGYFLTSIVGLKNKKALKKTKLVCPNIANKRQSN